MKRLALTLAVVLFNFTAQTPVNLEARETGTTGSMFCMECEQFWFYDYFQNVGDWFTGEECLNANGTTGFDYCDDWWEPGIDELDILTTGRSH